MFKWLTPRYSSSNKHIRNSLSAFICIFLLLAITGCSQETPDIQSKHQNNELSGKLIITGSSTVAPLVAEIAKQFEKNYPLTRIDVQTGGSSRGIADVRSKLSNIGMVSRSLKPNEQGLTPYAIARDGIAMIAHKDNSLETITSEQIKNIYLGHTTNWQSLNGQKAQITVVNKAEGRSTLELFLAYFVLKNSDIKASIIIGDNEQGVKTVIGNKNAIAYVSIGTAEYNIQHGAPIKLLKLNSIEASSNNVKQGNYPLSRILNLIVSEPNPSPLTTAFIAFSQSDAVSPLIKELNFVPLAQ